MIKAGGSLLASSPGSVLASVEVVVAINAPLCCVFVALWGAVGAAAAVAMTYAGSIVLLRVIVTRVLLLRI